MLVSAHLAMGIYDYIAEQKPRVHLLRDDLHELSLRSVPTTPDPVQHTAKTQTRDEMEAQSPSHGI